MTGGGYGFRTISPLSSPFGGHHIEIEVREIVLNHTLMSLSGGLRTNIGTWIDLADTHAVLRFECRRK